MSVKATGLGSPRNGLPGLADYTYHGTGDDELTPPTRRAGAARRERQPGLPGRVLTALRVLGGEASTTEIRTTVELDGGPAFHPGYLLQALNRLSRREPPAVTAAGREHSGKGRPARWQLGPGGDAAAGTAASRPAAVPVTGARRRKETRARTSALRGGDAACPRT